MSYILIFPALIKLRYSHADVPRVFSVPGGKVGLWAIGVPHALALGLLAFLLEFIPYFGPILSAVPAVLATEAIQLARIGRGDGCCHGLPPKEDQVELPE